MDVKRLSSPFHLLPYALRLWDETGQQSSVNITTAVGQKLFLLFQRILTFELKFICFLFQLQQNCYSWMISNLLFKITPARRVSQDTLFSLRLRRWQWILQFDKGNGDRASEPPTHCHRARVLMYSEEFPHITSSQTFSCLTVSSETYLYKTPQGSALTVARCLWRPFWDTGEKSKSLWL